MYFLGLTTKMATNNVTLGVMTTPSTQTIAPNTSPAKGTKAPGKKAHCQSGTRNAALGHRLSLGHLAVLSEINRIMSKRYRSQLFEGVQRYYNFNLKKKRERLY